MSQNHNPIATLALACPLTPPGADIPLHWLCAAMCQERTCSHSFQNIVGDCQQSGRNFDAQPFSGLQIDDECELGRLFDRKVCRS